MEEIYNKTIRECCDDEKSDLNIDNNEHDILVDALDVCTGEDFERADATAWDQSCAFPAETSCNTRTAVLPIG